MRAGGCETRATAGVCGGYGIVNPYGVGSQSADWGWPSGILGHLIWIMRLIRGGREAQTGSEWAGHWIRGLSERGSRSQHPRKIYEKQWKHRP